MKNERINKILVCVVLSLVVHTGLAATFVYAVRPVPIAIDLAKTIQVSLIEDYSDSIGTSNSNTVSLEVFSNPAQETIQDDILDTVNTVNTPATDSISEIDAAFADLPITEVEPLAQKLDTSDLINSKLEQELVNSEQVEAVPEPKFEIVDKSANSILSSIESSLTEIPDRYKLEQIISNSAGTSSNQSRSEQSTQAIESHAYRNHPDTGLVLRNTPIEAKLPDSDTLLEFSDFDNDFEPWVNFDHKTDSILQATLNLGSETALPEKAPQIGEDADELAGIETQPESGHDLSLAAELLATEINRTERASVKSFERLASIVDYDSQLQLLPRPELDAIQIHKSIEDIQPNITTEVVDTPSKSSLAKLDGSKPNQPQSDQDLSPVDESLAIEVSRAKLASVKPREQIASLVDHDSQFQLLPQPELDAVQAHQLEETSQPNVTSEIVDTPDETLLAKINVPAPTQHERSVRQPPLSVPSLSGHQKPVSDTTVASAVPATIDSNPKHQSDQQITISNDFSPEQNSPVESPSIDDSQQLASLNSASFDSAPEYGIRGLSNPAPRYPYRSRVNGEQGKVILEVLVNREGKAVEISIAKSSGFSRLDKAARKAVKRWQFQPALKSGRKVQGVVRVPIAFVLKNT